MPLSTRQTLLPPQQSPKTVSGHSFLTPSHSFLACLSFLLSLHKANYFALLNLDVHVKLKLLSLSTVTGVNRFNMLAMQANDENRDTSLPRDLSDKVCSWSWPTNVSQDLPPPPPLRKSRKHRPTPLDLSPTRQHLSPLDSNNPNAIEDYLFSSSPISANTTVGLGMPSPVHYSQTDLLNILESNPPLTPVPPLRTSPPAIESEAPDAPQLSPGLPPASHCDRQVDDIFVELLQTENSFLEEVNTIEIIVREILAPLGVADDRWLHAVEDLKDLHGTFVQDLIGEKMSGITPTVLKVLLKWVCVYAFDSYFSRKPLVLLMDRIFRLFD